MAGIGLALLCLLNLCSNDTLGVLGDEAIAWAEPDPVPPITTYDIYRNGVRCMTLIAPRTSAVLSGTECMAERGQALITVVACNTAGCSNPVPPAEFLTYSCLLPLPDCERPCFEGAPHYLPERYSPCP